jgi:hypothetical protein
LHPLRRFAPTTTVIQIDRFSARRRWRRRTILFPTIRGPLQGEFFKNKQTTAEFQQVLSLGDAIWLVPLPLGGTAFCKGGSIDVPGCHAL